MADGVAITAGSGTTVATDDCGAAGHAQIVKLAYSADGVATAALVDANGQAVQGQAAHDAAAAGNPVLVAGVASAAAPADVSADGDQVRAWRLRNGAAASVLTAAGALIGGDAPNGLDVDVTRVPTDPFGANADAASATGSISAKLRFIAATGIPVTSLPNVANGGTFAVQDSEKIADNGGFTDGTTKVIPVGLIFDEVAGTALTENDIGAARMDSKRAAVIAIEDATTRGQRLAISAGGAATTAPIGNVAHDSVDSGNPIKVGARAQAAAASVTAVAVADRTDLVSDLDGALITRVCRLADLIADVKAVTDGSSTAFTGSFAAAANLFNYITQVVIANSSTTAVTVDLRDGAAGSVIFTFTAPAGGGISVAFNPPLRQPTVNTALAVDPSAAASTVTTSVNGFKSKA